MDNSLFSCLIANYNNGKYIEDCFQSIIKQSYSNIEIVIVDDGSTDNSWDIIDSYKFPFNIKLTKFKIEQNYGCGFAKRKCVELASGDICGFIDPDDTLVEMAVEKMVCAHLTNPSVSLISSKFNYVNENLEFIKFGEIGEAVPDSSSYLYFGKNAITAFATFKLFRYLETIGINPQLKRAVDQDLYYKLEEVGNTLFINEFLYNYRITKNSISANDNSFKADYWHLFVVINEAIRRREKKGSLKSISKIEYAKMKNSHFVWRMKISNEQGNLRKKYYFTLRALLNYPFQNIFYLIKCLLFPKYA